MPYHVITATDKAGLKEEVEHFEKMDWKPQGGVAFYLYFTYEADKSCQNTVWAQAMTKKAPKVTINHPTKVPAYQELYRGRPPITPEEGAKNERRTNSKTGSRERPSVHRQNGQGIYGAS